MATGGPFVGPAVNTRNVQLFQSDLLFIVVLRFDCWNSKWVTRKSNCYGSDVFRTGGGRAMKYRLKRKKRTRAHLCVSCGYVAARCVSCGNTRNACARANTSRRKRSTREKDNKTHGVELPATAGYRSDSRLGVLPFNRLKSRDSNEQPFPRKSGILLRMPLRSQRILRYKANLEHTRLLTNRTFQNFFESIEWVS